MTRMVQYASVISLVHSCALFFRTTRTIYRLYTDAAAVLHVPTMCTKVRRQNCRHEPQSGKVYQ